MANPQRPLDSRSALAFIFVKLLIDMIGLSLIIPVAPRLFMELTGGSVGEAARYAGWLIFSYNVVQFFFAPIVGNLSDRFGRRPILLGSLAVFGLDHLTMAVAPTIGWIFLGRMVAGAAGASSATASAYIADVCPPEERAKGFGVIGAAFGLGFIIGPLLGASLGAYGIRVPFFVAAGLAFANLLFGYFVLPETLDVSNRRRFSWTRANPAGALIAMRRYPLIWSLLGGLFVYRLASDAAPTIWAYYTMLVFDWSLRDLGYSLCFLGVLTAIVQVGLVARLVPRLGERKTVYVGFAMMALSYFGFCFASEGWMMYAFILPAALGSVANPALGALLSAEVPADAQGELQGAVASLMNVGALVGPVTMTEVFRLFSVSGTAHYLPGAPFLLGVCLLAGATLVFRRAAALARSDLRVRGGSDPSLA